MLISLFALFILCCVYYCIDVKFHHLFAVVVEINSIQFNRHNTRNFTNRYRTRSYGDLVYTVSESLMSLFVSCNDMLLTSQSELALPSTVSWLPSRLSST